MSDNGNPEVLTVPENSSPRVLGLTIEEMGRDPAGAIHKFTEFVEAAKAAATQAAESQRQFTVSLAEMQSKLEEIKAASTLVLAAKTQITDTQAVVATKSDHIQGAQEHADKVRAELDRALTSATQQVTATEAHRASAQAAVAQGAELFAEMQRMRTTAEADGAAVANSKKTAEDSVAIAKGLADKSATVETRIAEYERRIADLDAQCEKQLKTIVGLLPGATGAGLAHAFDDRRKTFLKPQGGWQKVFVGSVILIILVAITGLWHVYQAGVTPTYDELIRLWLARLPVAGALVWLALHASHEAALAKRLEEDYGFKSAIASCFEGFQQQMSEVEKGVDPNSPLATLCGNTLRTIASPPGRIYDGHKLTVNPTDELKVMAKSATDAAKVVSQTPR
jgi:hypothetical protein